MNPSTFREYDIRGNADRDLGDDLVQDLGSAFVAELDVEAPSICVGSDCRLSSPRIKSALIEALVAAGAHVTDIGVVPSPVLYFAAGHLGTDASIIVTGSHNPSPENGFKMLRKTSSIYGAAITRLRDRIAAKDWAQSAARGTVETQNINQAYLDNACKSIDLGPRRLKVVVDAGNGTGGPAAVELYSRLGFDVVPLYCDMDGAFPNHHPDPTVEQNLSDLKHRVAQSGAELGLALDGDADRIGAVDAKGRVLWGDQLMILLGRQILQSEPGATFIGEVKCSQALYDELRLAGGNPIMWKVGHSLIKSKLKESGAMLAGEMSGHLFFAHRYLGFDDGIYAGARILELLSRSELRLSDHYDTLPRMVNTPEIRIPCPDEQKFEIVRKTTLALKNRSDVLSTIDIDGCRAQFGKGWGLVRSSNTQPSLVTRYEAADQKSLTAIQKIFESTIASLRH